MQTSDFNDLGRFDQPLIVIPSDSRDAWLTVGMALHYESGGSDEGYQVWTGWSRTSNRFDEQTQQSTWRNFAAKPGGKTGGSIIELARRHGYANGHASVAANPQPIAAVLSDWKTAPKPPTWKIVATGLLAKGHCIVATYRYERADGSLFAEKLRFEPKTFRWRHRIGDGDWLSGKAVGPIPPYALARLIEHADQPVFIVEGEKDADRLNSMGQVAISIERGHEAAAAPHLADRIVFIIPDNDKAGSDRANTLLAAIRASAASVRIVALPGLDEKCDVSDWLDAGHTVSDLVRLTEDAVQDEGIRRLTNVTWSDDVEINPVGRYLIKKVLPSSGIGFLYGPSYAGKTFAAHDMGMAIARGIPLAGKFETAHGIVIFIALEAEGGVRDRHVAHKRAYGVNGAKFAFLSYPLEICDINSAKGLIAQLVEVSEHAKAPVSLVIIDVLAKAMPGMDENSSRDMSLAVKHMEMIQKAIGGCVMAVHHTGKDAKAGMRGSSAAFAAADFVLRVDGSEQGGVRELWVEKLKNGEPKLVGTYRIEPQIIGKDEDGEDIESAIIKWVEGVRAKKRIDLTPHQKAALDHLDQILLNGKCETFVGRDGIPDNVKVVSLNGLIERCNQGGDVTSSEQPRSTREAIRNQINKLQSKGLIHQFDGKVWRIKEV